MVSRTVRQRLAAGVLGAFLGGMALTGVAPVAAADDLHAGEIEETAQIAPGTLTFDTNGDENDPKDDAIAAVPLVPVSYPVLGAAGAVPNATDTAQGAQGVNVDDGAAP